MRRRLPEAAKVMEKNLDATTNPVGGHECRDEVSLQFLFRFMFPISLRNRANWLLVPLDSFAGPVLSMPPEKPGWILQEDPPEDLEVDVILGNDLRD